MKERTQILRGRGEGEGGRLMILMVQQSSSEEEEEEGWRDWESFHLLSLIKSGKGVNKPLPPKKGKGGWTVPYD